MWIFRRYRWVVVVEDINYKRLFKWDSCNDDDHHHRYDFFIIPFFSLWYFFAFPAIYDFMISSMWIDWFFCCEIVTFSICIYGDFSQDRLFLIRSWLAFLSHKTSIKRSKKRKTLIFFASSSLNPLKEVFLSLSKRW